MPRVFALALLSVAAIGGSIKPATCAAADTLDAATTAPLKVVVLPARAHAVELRMLSSGESEEWTALARANLDAAIQELVDQSPEFVGVTLPELSAEQHAAINEFVAVANLTSTRFGGLIGGPKVQRTSADRALGPSLAFLQERTDALNAGTAVPHGLLVTQLDAPQLGYFARVLPAFEESVGTIVLRPRRHLH